MILTITLLPLVGGLSLFLLKKLGLKPAYTALAAGAATFGCAGVLLCMAGRGVEAAYGFALPLGMGLSLQLDMLSAFMAASASFLSLVIIFYSTGYIHDKNYETEYYSLVLVFLGAMMGLVFSVNLVWTFIFWEITAICSWRLVGFFRADNDRKKAVKTFLVTVFGALFLLLGITAVGFFNGSFDLNVLKGQNVPALACILLIIGMFSKSAILPFSTWLPDAGVAPSPVTALLHAAVLVKIGVYAFARVFYTVNLDPGIATGVMYVAALSTLVAGGAAILETNIKRIIAYSTISQLGFIFLALACRSTAGLIAGMLFILFHGIAKGGLFLCAGIIEHKTHTKDITKMGGLLKYLPKTAVAFALCALSVMGIPPLAGFFSKYSTFAAAYESAPWQVFMLFFIAACFTAAYLLRLFHKVFMAEPADRHTHYDNHEGSVQMVGSVMLLGVLALIGGLFFAPIVNYLADAAVQMGVL